MLEEQDPDKQAFINAVLAPLPPDPGAREMLEQAVQTAGEIMRDGGSTEVREAAARMQASASAYRKRQLLGRALGIITMLGIAWLALFSSAALSSLKGMLVASDLAERIIPRFLQESFFHDDSEDWVKRRVAERLAPEQRLVACGDYTQILEHLRWKAVWDQHPEDPGHFLSYAESLWSYQNKWPDDFVATGERLDPGNGWFRLLSVTSRTRDLIRRGASGSRRPVPGSGPAPLPTIKSEPELQALLFDWDRALEMPRWDDYRSRLHSERMKGWPPPEDYVDQVLGVHLAFSPPENRIGLWAYSIRFDEFVELLAEYYAIKGDRVALEALVRRFEKTVERFAGGPPDYRQAVIHRFAGRAARGLAKAFTELGDATRAGHFTTFADRLDPRKVTPPSLPVPDALGEMRGSRLAMALGYMGSRPTPVAEMDLRGGRLAEYAMFERLQTYAVVLLLFLVIVCLCLAGLRERRGTRRLSSRLAGLLRPVDRAWVAGLGVALPVVVYLLCLRLPWLEMRDFTLQGWHHLALLALSCGLFLSLVLCTAEALHWRLSRCAAVAGFGWHGMQPGRWIAILALLAMPVSLVGYKVLSKSSSMDDDWLPAFNGSLFALPLLWMLWMCFAFFGGAAHRRLQRLTLVRALLPFLTGACLLVALGMLALHQEEKYWTRRIAYEAVSPDRPAFNGSLGDEYVAWLQAQVRGALAELKQAEP